MSIIIYKYDIDAFIFNLLPIIITIRLLEPLQSIYILVPYIFSIKRAPRAFEEGLRLATGLVIPPK